MAYYIANEEYYFNCSTFHMFVKATVIARDEQLSVTQALSMTLNIK